MPRLEDVHRIVNDVHGSAGQKGAHHPPGSETRMGRQGSLNRTVQENCKQKTDQDAHVPHHVGEQRYDLILLFCAEVAELDGPDIDGAGKAPGK